MTAFPLLPIKFDVAPLLAELDANPDLWGSIDLRKATPGTPHREMTDIWVRYNDVAPYRRRGSFMGFNDPHVPVWYPAWARLPALRPIIAKLMAKLQGEMLGGVLITRVPAGGKIEPHVDTGWHVDYFQKFYVALKSLAGAALCVEGEEITPPVGSVHFFDNRQEHWVRNEGDGERMTLIVCIRTDQFR